jgi:hypothetical protein
MRWPDRKTKDGWTEYKSRKKTRRHIPDSRERRLEKVKKDKGRRGFVATRTKTVRQEGERARQARTSQPRCWKPLRVKRDPYPHKRFWVGRLFTWTESYSMPVVEFFKGWMEAIRTFGNPEVADAMVEKVTTNPTLH